MYAPSKMILCFPEAHSMWQLVRASPPHLTSGEHGTCFGQRMQALRELLGASFLVAGLCEAGPEGCVGWPTSVGQASEGQSLSCWPDPAPPASQRPAKKHRRRGLALQWAGHQTMRTGVSALLYFAGATTASSQSSVRNGEAGRLAPLKRLPSPLGDQP